MPNIYSCIVDNSMTLTTISNTWPKKSESKEVSLCARCADMRTLLLFLLFYIFVSGKNQTRAQQNENEKKGRICVQRNHHQVFLGERIFCCWHRHHSQMDGNEKTIFRIPICVSHAKRPNIRIKRSTNNENNSQRGWTELTRADRERRIFQQYIYTYAVDNDTLWVSSRTYLCRIQMKWTRLHARKKKKKNHFNWPTRFCILFFANANYRNTSRTI